jgi:hypothetical protein
MTGISTSFPGSVSIVAIGNCGDEYILNVPDQVTVDGLVVYTGRTEGFTTSRFTTAGGAMGGPIFYTIEPNALPTGQHTIQMIEYNASTVICTLVGDLTITSLPEGQQTATAPDAPGYSQPAAMVSAAAAAQGAITFDPDTLTCTPPSGATWIIRLPSSVKRGDQLSMAIDGKQPNQPAPFDPTDYSGGNEAPSSRWTQEADGSWIDHVTVMPHALQQACPGYPSEIGLDLTPGHHTVAIISNGTVVAQGSYNVEP